MLGNPERGFGQTAVDQRCQRLGSRFDNHALLDKVVDQTLHGLDAMTLRLWRCAAQDGPGISQHQAMDFWLQSHFQMPLAATPKPTQAFSVLPEIAFSRASISASICSTTARPFQASINPVSKP
ncbi:hypothetical protein QYS36_20765 [Pseudomonas sp. G34]|nr:hypothetical protein [Pseudomonas sp. G34]MDQ7987378.1 hypothetical protein [Pseudomonas sp. G34]